MTQLSHAPTRLIQWSGRKNPTVMQNESYQLRGVYVRKAQIQIFMKMSRYQLNKYIIPPLIREKMNISPGEYRHLQAFSPQQFQILREVHKWSDEELKEMLQC